jgi:mycothiol synthase
MTQHQGFTIRNFSWNDIPHLVDAFNLSAKASGDIYQFNADELRDYLEGPDVDMEADGRVALVDGQLVAEADLEFEPHIGRGWAGCFVHPDFRGRGIGTALLRATDVRALERGQRETPPEKPVYVQRAAISTASDTINLLTEHGYERIRSFFIMQTELTQPVGVLPSIDGLEFRDFDPERDLQAAYTVQQAAFADHWGFTPDPIENWREYFMEIHNFDPSLWTLAWDGGQPAGIAMCRPFSEKEADLGWVNILAVRREYRKRGLGSALLQHSFARFQAKGYRRAGLGVDAASPTNAVALYERAGMYIRLRRDVFRKVLRGSAEDISP